MPEEFWLSDNNNNKSQVGKFKAGVRRDKIDKKHRHIFDAYDQNHDRILDSSELDTLSKNLSSFAGEDRTLDASENKRVGSIFANQCQMENVDFMGFVKSVSDASEDITDTKETTNKNGNKEITTTDKDGNQHIYRYDRNGDYDSETIKTTEHKKYQIDTFLYKERKISKNRSIVKFNEHSTILTQAQFDYIQSLTFSTLPDDNYIIFKGTSPIPIEGEEKAALLKGCSKWEIPSFPPEYRAVWRPKYIEKEESLSYTNTPITIAAASETTIYSAAHIIGLFHKLDYKVKERLSQLPPEALAKIGDGKELVETLAQQGLRPTFDNLSNVLEIMYGVTLRNEQELKESEPQRKRIITQIRAARMMAEYFSMAADWQDQFTDSLGIAGLGAEGLNWCANKIASPFGVSANTPMVGCNQHQWATIYKNLAKKSFELKVLNPQKFEKDFRNLYDGVINDFHWNFDPARFNHVFELVESGKAKDEKGNYTKEFIDAATSAIGFRISNPNKDVVIQVANGLGEAALMVMTLGASAESDGGVMLTRSTVGAMSKLGTSIASKQVNNKLLQGSLRLLGNGVKLMGPALNEGIKMAGYTFATGTAANAIHSAATGKTFNEFLAREDLIASATTDSFAFGAFAGVFGSTITPKVMQTISRTSSKVTAALADKFAKGAVRGNEAFSAILENSTPTILAEAAGFATDVVGFAFFETAYTLATKMKGFPNEVTMEQVVELLSDEFKNQGVNLGQIKVVSHMIMFMSGSRSARLQATKYMAENNPHLKDVEITKDGESYIIKMKDGKEVKCKDSNEMILACHLIARNETPLGKMFSPKSELDLIEARPKIEKAKSMLDADVWRSHTFPKEEEFQILMTLPEEQLDIINKRGLLKTIPHSSKLLSCAEAIQLSKLSEEAWQKINERGILSEYVNWSKDNSISLDTFLSFADLPEETWNNLKSRRLFEKASGSVSDKVRDLYKDPNILIGLASLPKENYDKLKNDFERNYPKNADFRLFKMATNSNGVDLELFNKLQALHEVFHFGEVETVRNIASAIMVDGKLDLAAYESLSKIAKKAEFYDIELKNFAKKAATNPTEFRADLKAKEDYIAWAEKKHIYIDRDFVSVITTNNIDIVKDIASSKLDDYNKSKLLRDIEILEVYKKYKLDFSKMKKMLNGRDYDFDINSLRIDFLKQLSKKTGKSIEQLRNSEDTELAELVNREIAALPKDKAKALGIKDTTPVKPKEQLAPQTDFKSKTAEAIKECFAIHNIKQTGDIDKFCELIPDEKTANVIAEYFMQYSSSELHYSDLGKVCRKIQTPEQLKQFVEILNSSEIGETLKTPYALFYSYRGEISEKTADYLKNVTKEGLDVPRPGYPINFEEIDCILKAKPERKEEIKKLYHSKLFSKEQFYNIFRYEYEIDFNKLAKIDSIIDDVSFLEAREPGRIETLLSLSEQELNVVEARGLLKDIPNRDHLTASEVKKYANVDDATWENIQKRGLLSKANPASFTFSLTADQVVKYAEIPNELWDNIVKRDLITIQTGISTKNTHITLLYKSPEFIERMANLPDEVFEQYKDTFQNPTEDIFFMDVLMKNTGTINHKVLCKLKEITDLINAYDTYKAARIADGLMRSGEFDIQTFGKLKALISDITKYQTDSFFDENNPKHIDISFIQNMFEPLHSRADHSQRISISGLKQEFSIDGPQNLAADIEAKSNIFKLIKESSREDLSLGIIMQATTASNFKAIEKLIKSDLPMSELESLLKTQKQETLSWLFEHDFDKAYANFKAQKQLFDADPSKYINGDDTSSFAIKFQRDKIFKVKNIQFMTLCSIYDKETLNNFLRMRVDEAVGYLETFDEFSPKELNLLNGLCKSTTLDGKPFMPNQKIGFIDMIEAYKSCELDMSKMEEMVKTGKIDIGALHIDLFTQLMKKCGMSDAQIAQIPKSKLVSWDMKYAHLLAKELNDSGQEDNTLANLLRVANSDTDFMQYIHDPNNAYGKSNANTKASFSEMGMKYDSWLHPSKDSEVRFVAKDKNTERIEQITDQLTEDINELIKNPFIKKTLIKQFPNCLKQTENGEVFVIPEKYTTSKSQLKVFIDILTDESQTGQLGSIWKRAKQNATQVDNPNAQKAQATLTILDHLNQRAKDLETVEDVSTEKTRDWTIKMWDRLPQKDLFQGNYSTCCIGMGGGNGSAMPHYIMNTSFNMIEIVDNVTGKTVANALCYFVKGENGKPIFIIDNIEINNSVKPSDKVGQDLRGAIVEYGKNICREVTGTDETPICLGQSYNDVPIGDLKARSEEVKFVGDIDTDSIYTDLYHDWSDIKPQRPVKMFELSNPESIDTFKEKLTTISDQYGIPKDDTARVLSLLPNTQSANVLLEYLNTYKDNPSQAEALKTAIRKIQAQEELDCLINILSSDKIGENLKKPSVVQQCYFYQGIVSQFETITELGLDQPRPGKSEIDITDCLELTDFFDVETRDLLIKLYKSKALCKNSLHDIQILTNNTKIDIAKFEKIESMLDDTFELQMSDIRALLLLTDNELNEIQSRKILHKVPDAAKGYRLRYALALCKFDNATLQEAQKLGLVGDSSIIPPSDFIKIAELNIPASAKLEALELINSYRERGLSPASDMMELSIVANEANIKSILRKQNSNLAKLSMDNSNIGSFDMKPNKEFAKINAYAKISDDITIDLTSFNIVLALNGLQEGEKLIINKKGEIKPYAEDVTDGVLELSKDNSGVYIKNITSEPIKLLPLNKSVKLAKISDSPVKYKTKTGEEKVANTIENVTEYLSNYKLYKFITEQLIELYQKKPEQFNEIANSGIFELVNAKEELTGILVKLLNKNANYEDINVNRSTLNEIALMKAQLDAGEPFSRVRRVPQDAPIDTVVSELQTGDVFEYKGSLYVKHKTPIAEYTKLNMTKECFDRLFPPLSNAFGQGSVGDCWLVSTLDNIMDKPKCRAMVYSMFRQEGNDIYVTFPKSKKEICFPNGEVIDAHGAQIRGSLGIRMLEQAFAVDCLESGRPVGANSAEETAKLLKKRKIAKSLDAAGVTGLAAAIDVSKLTNMKKLMKIVNGGFSSEVYTKLFPLSPKETYSNVLPDSATSLIQNYANNQNKLVQISFTGQYTSQRDIEKSIDPARDIVSLHMYAVKSYDAKTDTCYLTNPWDTTKVIRVPMSFIRENVSSIEILHF